MKKIALINDLSGFGKCSLTAAIPVISVMGVQACPFPTAVLSSQTGFNSFYCDDFTDRMDNFTCEWKKITNRFDGIYSGFLANPKQIEKVINFISEFDTTDTVILVDPVMGDNGRTIKSFSNVFLQEMQKLVSKATVTTPNLTEACYLVGESYEEIVSASDNKELYLDKIKEISKKLFRQNLKLNKELASQTIITTGVLRQENEKSFIGNFAITFNAEGNVVNSFYVESEYTKKSFSGTGDLFASVICGGLVKGFSIEESMNKAVTFLNPAITEASKENVDRNHGVNFEKYLSLLLNDGKEN